VFTVKLSSEKEKQRNNAKCWKFERFCWAKLPNIYEHGQKYIYFDFKKWLI